MAPWSVVDTCDCTATSANLRGRYFRAREIDIGDLKAKTNRAGMDSLHHPRECPRPDEATIDTSCRCYLRGPDGVRRLLPSGTWDPSKITRQRTAEKRSERQA